MKQKTILASLCILSVVITCQPGCSAREHSVVERENVVNLDQAADFDTLVASGVVLVDFYADWCPPCRKLAPVLEAIADEQGDQILIVKVDVDKHRGLAERFNIRSIPHLFLYRDGSTVDSQLGAGSKAQLLAWIAEKTK